MEKLRVREVTNLSKTTRCPGRHSLQICTATQERRARSGGSWWGGLSSISCQGARNEEPAAGGGRWLYGLEYGQRGQSRGGKCSRAHCRS